MVRTLLSVLLFLHPVFALASGPPPANVILGQVSQKEVAATQSVTGVIYYERVSEISTEVAGLVKEITVRQGDRVKKDDVLVVLDTEILDREILLTKTRIDQAQLRVNNSRKNFIRLETLYNKEGVSEKDYDDAAFVYRDAQKEKLALEESLGKLLIKKERSIIRAPFAGVVLTKNVDSGAWVQQGKILVSLGSIHDLFVRAPISENLLRFVNAGEKVSVLINAFAKELMGEVVGIDPVADVKTKNIFLKIRIASMDNVAENMSARVFVPSSVKNELAVFNRAALVKFQGKDFVYTVVDNKASIVPVTVVAYLGEQVAVESPVLRPGMAVVVEGNERLRPDQPVRVAGEK